MNQELQNSTARPPRRRMNENPKTDRFKMLRWWLNVIFMLGAVVGVTLYLTLDNQNTGIIVILVSMVFKFIEAALRLMR
ncbi:hypothetical protein [Prevotella ihumii]|uniref:hypothetical protein n=1 Tax=Prevotella ihumii TaxID=1917878 RepID=UPI000981D2AB|nr:hypothetical protein [Prevotella ihumii]